MISEQFKLSAQELPKVAGTLVYSHSSPNSNEIITYNDACCQPFFINKGVDRDISS